jgi:hypothetical protein
MYRFRWSLLVFIICLPVAILASGVNLPWRNTAPGATPLPVPDGDQEVVFLHTTTNAGTWERFVAGVQRAASSVPGMRVDDSGAFLDRTTAAPEVVIGLGDRPGLLRVRWYKLSSYAKTAAWVQALAHRDPAPLAIIGGGSSDRARDLAIAMAHHTDWSGDRPALMITTATAEKVEPEADTAPDPVQLVRIYAGRTFRFSFGDRQMAEAMIDFVYDRPELRPAPERAIAAPAVASGLAAAGPPHKPAVLYVDWNDDPYSSDLLDQFKVVLQARSPQGPRWFGWQVPFSIGGYYVPNQAEAEAADAILRELQRLPPQRVLLVVPTVAPPARRLLRTLCDADPFIGRRLVAINGDGFQVNTLLRDGEFAWPVYALPVPLILFTHNDPIAWSASEEQRALSDHHAWPSSTEDVLHFAELTRFLVEAVYPKDSPTVTRADELVERFRARSPAYFDSAGNRLGGKGEYIVLFKPTTIVPGEGGLPEATLEVWRRAAAGGWEMTRSLPIHQSRAGRRGE